MLSSSRDILPRGISLSPSELKQFCRGVCPSPSRLHSPRYLRGLECAAAHGTGLNRLAVVDLCRITALLVARDFDPGPQSEPLRKKLRGSCTKKLHEITRYLRGSKCAAGHATTTNRLALIDLLGITVLLVARYFDPGLQSEPLRKFFFFGLQKKTSKKSYF